ncbi:unnamed protein product, partial [Cuscuta campestris]
MGRSSHRWVSGSSAKPVSRTMPNSDGEFHPSLLEPWCKITTRQNDLAQRWEVYPIDGNPAMGYHDLDNQLQASGLWSFVSRSRSSFNPAFVRAFYSNLRRDGDTIRSSINLYDIEIDLATFARVAGLPTRGDDITTYGGDDWILNNEAVVIRELGITNLIRHSGAPTIHSAP